MSTGTHTSPRALVARGCATGTLERAMGLGVVRTPAWRALAASWDGLPETDPTSRDQRFADFRCVAGDDDFKVFEQLAYRFAPAEHELCANPALRAVLLWLVRELDQADGEGEAAGVATGVAAGVAGAPGLWQARCFRNRTVAHPGRPGLPAPEGAQRGGADYSAVVLVRRAGVVGGSTVVHRVDADAEPGPTEAQVLLTRPGDFVLTDDRRLQQRASPVALAGRGTTAGHRDVLVVRFARL